MAYFPFFVPLLIAIWLLLFSSSLIHCYFYCVFICFGILFFLLAAFSNQTVSCISIYSCLVSLSIFSRFVLEKYMHIMLCDLVLAAFRYISLFV